MRLRLPGIAVILTRLGVLLDLLTKRLICLLDRSRNVGLCDRWTVATTKLVVGRSCRSGRLWGRLLDLGRRWKLLYRRREARSGFARRVAIDVCLLLVR